MEGLILTFLVLKKTFQVQVVSNSQTVCVTEFESHVSLSIMPSMPVYIVANSRISFILMAE